MSENPPVDLEELKQVPVTEILLRDRTVVVVTIGASTRDAILAELEQGRRVREAAEEIRQLWWGSPRNPDDADLWPLLENLCLALAAEQPREVIDVRRADGVVLVCPGCGMRRDLPSNWREILRAAGMQPGWDGLLRCTKCELVMALAAEQPRPEPGCDEDWTPTFEKPAAMCPRCKWPLPEQPRPEEDR